MKRTVLATIAATLCGSTVWPAYAEPGVMFGMSHNFGGSTGVTFKVLSTDRKERVAAALGLSYFPTQEPRAWGVDTSMGYTLHRGALTLGYDWLNEQMQLGLGVANTRSRAAVVPTSSDFRTGTLNTSDVRRLTDIQLTEAERKDTRNQLMERFAKELYQRVMETF